jgi:hypothetical protein
VAVPGAMGTGCQQLRLCFSCLSAPARTGTWARPIMSTVLLTATFRGRRFWVPVCRLPTRLPIQATFGGVGEHQTAPKGSNGGQRRFPDALQSCTRAHTPRGGVTPGTRALTAGRQQKWIGNRRALRLVKASDRGSPSARTAYQPARTPVLRATFIDKRSPPRARVRVGFERLDVPVKPLD